MESIPSVLKKNKSATETISRKALLSIQYASIQSLAKLVTSTGIYASSATDIFHGLFGRDTATVYSFILEDYKLIRRRVGDFPSPFADSVLEQHEQLFVRALEGFLYIGRYQGKVDNPVTGEEKGKAIHEVRHDPNSYFHLTEGKRQKGEKPFYVDHEGVLKNWDTVDATFLRIIAIGKTMLLRHQLSEKSKSYALENAFKKLQKEVDSSRFRDSVEWCLSNSRKYGFPGFSYDLARREFTNFPNKHWADSSHALLHEDYDETPYPKKPVEVAAYAWAAFHYAGDLYADRDPSFARLLRQTAKDLKKRFNKDEASGGFLLFDKKTNLYYCAEGLDGRGNQIKVIMCNPVMSLWATYHGGHIIKRRYIADIIKRSLLPDMFRDDAGIRTYNKNILKTDAALYHKGPETFWPFVSVAAAIGMERVGYRKAAHRTFRAAIRGVMQFSSKDPSDQYYAPFIENFIAEGNSFRPFFADHQTSCREQAWTASGMLYATSSLLFHINIEPD